MIPNTNFARGFVTVATGKDWYYVLANNLLASYRYHSQNPLPFAIICDRHNKWTEDFDQVIVMDNPACSFVDKLRIIDLSPFDETIFIDADCLAYKDLNGLWDIFKGSPDFGLLGDTHIEGMWWSRDNLGVFKDKVHEYLSCQGGIYYVRNNGKDIKAFFETCFFIKERYADFKFKLFERTVSDEMIVTLASSVHGFTPVRPWRGVIAYYPLIKDLDLDIRTGNLFCEFSDYPGIIYKDSYIVHFGTKATIKKWVYSREVFMFRKRPSSKGFRIDMALEWGRYFMTKILWYIRYFIPGKLVRIINEKVGGVGKVH
ncbi:MAG: hypothetical protein IJK32_03050 [Bacteroidales bacterium]|nr:hypothetical protein [Bacteroidales bacterium]